MARLSVIFLLIYGLAFGQVTDGKDKKLQIAFLADIHLQDIYGSFQDSDYKGIINPKTGKYTLLRTMESQLHSTRLFNENYFALLAALDDIALRGIKLVALPGDYSDDGQPVNVRGLHKMLSEYTARYQMQFFITTGNHDPSRPFLQQAGKDDFMGTNGRKQPIFSRIGMHNQSTDELPPVISPDISKMGYEGIISELKEFGFFPIRDYIFWATPFSSYTPENYSYELALAQSSLSGRNYEVSPGCPVPDASYVVEPVEGLWLLALDGNTYIPKYNCDPKAPDNYSGADLGYNNVLSNKQHLLKWAKKIAADANRLGKTLIAFSHYPMVDFNDGASEEIGALMGIEKWQLERVPQQDVAAAFADAGIKIHFAGHMHINDTGSYTSKNGNTLVNIQTPSLAAYVPAYKLLAVKNSGDLEIETVVIGEVKRFDELFDLYRMEDDFLKSHKSGNSWDAAILNTKSYREFTKYHLKELVRLRFLPEDWPLAFKDFLSNISGKNLLLLAHMQGKEPIDSLIKNKLRFGQQWTKAEQDIKAMLQTEKMHEDALQWSGMDFINDFYLLRSADQLAIPDIPADRFRQYKIIMDIFFENYVANPEDTNKKNLWLFLTIFDKFLEGAPAGHFMVNSKTGEVTEFQK